MDDQISSVAADPEVEPEVLRRTVIAGLVGTCLEQYDFVIYATASALVFNAVFFPNAEPSVGIIESLGTYAVGFAARPLGGLFFSRYGDRLGRKWVLVGTLFLMGIATFAIGCLPTFGAVGLLAPALLVLCRFLQGFGAGAEQAGGVTLLAETSPVGRRGFFSSTVYAGAAAGSALGAIAWILVQLMPDQSLQSFGWRIVFWSSAFVTLAAYIFRRRLNESPVFAETETKRIGVQRTPIGDVLGNGIRPLWRVFLVNLGSNGQSYTYQVFMGAYLVTWLGVQADFIPKVLLFGAIGSFLAALGTGAATDRFGRKPVIMAVLIFLFVLPVPAFLLLNTKNAFLIGIVVVVGFMIAGYGTVGSQGAWYAEMFGSRYRYAGITLAREFSAVFGGGVAPVLSGALIKWATGQWWPVAVYMMILIGLSLFAASRSPETRGRDLHPEADAV